MKKVIFVVNKVIFVVNKATFVVRGGGEVVVIVGISQSSLTINISNFGVLFTFLFIYFVCEDTVNNRVECGRVSEEQALEYSILRVLQVSYDTVRHQYVCMYVRGCKCFCGYVYLYDMHIHLHTRYVFLLIMLTG